MDGEGEEPPRGTAELLGQEGPEWAGVLAGGVFVELLAVVYQDYFGAAFGAELGVGRHVVALGAEAFDGGAGGGGLVGHVMAFAVAPGRERALVRARCRAWGAR